MKKLDEAAIIYGLYDEFLGRGHKFCCHNTTSVLRYVGETDFISMNANGTVFEVEVKISRADFRNDFVKKNRHQHLSGTGVEQLRLLDYRTRNGRFIRCVEPYQFMHESIPNYFYYAVPEGLITLDEVPDYCGLIYISEVDKSQYSPNRIVCRQVRKAKRLHSRSASDKQVKGMLRTLTFKSQKLMQNNFFDSRRA